MERDVINPPDDWGAAFAMDQGHVVSGASRTLYLSGQAAIETDHDAEMGVRIVAEGNMRAQFGHVLAKIDALLEQAGMTRSNIVFLRFYNTDDAAFLEHYDVYATWIGEAGITPPQTAIQVANLAVPGLVIEVEVVAAE